jgi:hypothetical protein
MIVESGFYLLSLVAFLMVIPILKNGDQPKRLILNYIILLLLWLGYAIVISQSGLLKNFTLPPRVPLLLVIPSIVLIIFVTGRPSFKSVLMKTPIHLPVFLISFRVFVELLIYGAYRNGIFPKRVTFEGLNFDVLVGLSSLIIGMLLVKKMISLQALWIWNIISMLVLTLTMFSFVSAYYFTDWVTTTGHDELVSFPYLLLVSVLLPIAIFLHVFIVRQIVNVRHRDEA